MFTIEAHPLLVYMTALPFAQGMPAVYGHFNDPSLFPQVTGQIGPLDFSLETFLGPRDVVWSMALSPDGTKLASGSMDSTIQVWDTSTGLETLPALHGHGNTVLSVVFSPDGTRIASCSIDKTVLIWDATSGDKLLSLRGHEQTVVSVSFSADSIQIVSGSHDKTIRIWNAISGAQVRLPLRGHGGCVISAAFSPDSMKIVSCSRGRAIRVWDTASGSEIFSPLRLETMHDSVTFSPDGCRVISKSRTDVTSWDSTSGCRLSVKESGYLPSHSIAVISGSQYTPYWIEDIETGRTISNLPFLVRGSCSLSFGNLLAVGTTTGNVFFMRFPSAIWTCMETRATNQPRSSDQVSLAVGRVNQPFEFSYSCGQYYTYRHHIV